MKHTHIGLFRSKLAGNFFDVLEVKTVSETTVLKGRSIAERGREGRRRERD